MKLEAETLDKMICFSPITVEDMLQLNIKFWISKEYTDFPTNYNSIDVIKTYVLNDDTVLLGTEEQFLKYKLK
jgi:hypothetical protein